MSTNDSPSSLPPRRAPLLVRLAYGQLILAALALTAVPVLALKKSQAPDPLAVVSAAGVEEAEATSEAVVSVAAAPASADPMARGATVYGQSCAPCHQATGAGIPGVFPPLAGSDYLLADPERAVAIVLHGLSGPVTVNGVQYASVMPPMPLEDADVAAVLTYTLRSWGNQGPAVAPETVARIRSAGARP